MNRYCGLVADAQVEGGLFRGAIIAAHGWL